MSTPRLNHSPIKMTNKGQRDGLQKRGDFFWHINDKGQRSLGLALPMPLTQKQHLDKNFVENHAWCLSYWTIDHKNSCDAQWSWDGNEEQPTLSPSLHAVNCWHGWVKQGELIEA